MNTMAALDAADLFFSQIGCVLLRLCALFGSPAEQGGCAGRVPLLSMFFWKDFAPGLSPHRSLPSEASSR